MLTKTARTAYKRHHATLMALTLALCLSLAGGSATAQVQDQDTEVVVERPVVVVRSTSHQPNLTWTVEGGRSFLGVQTLDLTPELREHFGVPPEAGVLVARILPESPAAESDLQVGDVISALDGEHIVSPSDLARAVGHHESGDEVDLEVWRQGQVRSVRSSLVERQGPHVDIRQFRIPEGRLEYWTTAASELEGAIELETETLNRAIEKLNEEMASPEWERRIHSFHEHQGTLMQRINVLETRLEELEKELEGLAEDE
jgi:hypothetical protein